MLDQFSEQPLRVAITLGVVERLRFVEVLLHARTHALRARERRGFSVQADFEVRAWLGRAARARFDGARAIATGPVVRQRRDDLRCRHRVLTLEKRRALQLGPTGERMIERAERVEVSKRDVVVALVECSHRRQPVQAAFVSSAGGW